MAVKKAAVNRFLSLKDKFIKYMFDNIGLISVGMLTLNGNYTGQTMEYIRDSMNY